MDHRRLALAWLVFGAAAARCGPRAGDAPDPTATSTGARPGTGPTTSAASASSGVDGDAGVDESTGAPFEPVACPRPSGKTESVCNIPFPPEDTWISCTQGHCESSMCDPDNCGQCGHECYKTCREGVCPSDSSTCIDNEADATTCTEVCARDGALCEDRVASESGHAGCDRGYDFALVSDFGLPGCTSASNVDAPSHVDIGCDDPIGWDHGTPKNPMSSITCCCRGDLE